MPNLKNRPPKYLRSGKYAVVYHHGKRIYLGDYGTPESQVAYSRFVAERQSSPTFYLLSKGEASVSIKELTATFLDYAVANIDSTEYGHLRVIVVEFLLKLYGDNTPVDSFKPSCLKLVRAEFIQSRRFCRKIVNSYTRRLVSIFAWGVEHELVPETIWRAWRKRKRKIW